MSPWMESFARWNTADQMWFSLAVAALSFLLVVMAGVWTGSVFRAVVDGVTVWVRGYPPVDKALQAQLADAASKVEYLQKELDALRAENHNLRSCIRVNVPGNPFVPADHATGRPPRSVSCPDWREELRRHQEEQAFEAEVQAKLQEEMEQAKALSSVGARLAKPGAQASAPDDVCDNPLNATGRCLKAGGTCRTDGECGREVERHRKPDDPGAPSCKGSGCSSDI